MTNPAVRAALRTSLFSFVGGFVPALLGWLNNVSQWASDHGSRPFPATSVIVYAAVAAVVAAVTGLINGVWISLERAEKVPALLGGTPTYYKPARPARAVRRATRKRSR